MLAPAASFLLGHLVVAQMLWLGLITRPGHFADLRRRPRLYLRALWTMELAVPVLTMATVALFRLPALPTALFVLMALCPGAALVPRAARRKGQSYSRFGLNLLVLVSLLAPVTIPIWIWVLERVSPFDLDVSPWLVLEHVASAVLLPLAAGIAMRRILPARMSVLLARVAHLFFVVALAVGVAVALYLGGPVLLHVGPRTVIAGVVIVIGSALMGYFAEGPWPEARRAAGIAAALGNPGLVLAVVAASYPGFRSAAFIAAYILFRRLVLIPFDMWSRKTAEQLALAR